MADRLPIQGWSGEPLAALGRLRIAVEDLASQGSFSRQDAVLWDAVLALIDAEQARATEETRP